MSIRIDYLPNHIDIKLYQHKKMFRINTDTCLLGEFLDFEPNLSVLDVGTNNSALLLYSSLLKPKNMVGIDINNEALELAKKEENKGKYMYGDSLPGALSFWESMGAEFDEDEDDDYCTPFHIEC